MEAEPFLVTKRRRVSVRLVVIEDPVEREHLREARRMFEVSKWMDEWRSRWLLLQDDFHRSRVLIRVPSSLF